LSYNKTKFFYISLSFVTFSSFLFASSSGVTSFYQEQKKAKNAPLSEDEKKILILKNGYSIIKNKCSRCHISPFDVAKSYRTKQWTNLFKYNINTNKFSSDRNLLKNNKFYYTHSRSIRRKSSFINSMKDNSLKTFLLFYSKDSGRARCLSK